MCIFGFMLMFCLVVSIVFWLVGSFFSSKLEVDKEKGGSYECGFESFYLTRVPFSLQFFMIGVIFLIFDVEIVLMLPMILVSKVMIFEGLLFSFFILLLLFGLYYEWCEGSLEWVK